MTADRTPTLVLPIPSRESAAAKAIRLLVEGRVRLQLLHRGRCHALVNGDTGVYRVNRHPSGMWRCTCAAMNGRCSHVRAVRLVVDTTNERQPA